MSMKRGVRIKIGNFTNIVKIMVFAGVSVGGTERIRLKHENAKVPTIIPSNIIRIFILSQIPKKIIPINKGTIEKMQPKINELQIFPIKIVLIEIGHVISLSKVFARVSHGKTTGPIDVEVMNITIAINPDIK